MKNLIIDLESLARCRISKGITMKEMAEAMGLKTPGGYARIESGDVRLRAEHLPVIADKFEMTVSQLVKLIFRGSCVEQTSNKEPA